MKTALITGASSGIGKAMAQLMAEKNINLVLIARSGDKLNTLKSQLESKHGVSARCIVKDLSLPEAPAEIADILKTENIEIDYLINNAGVGTLASFTDYPWDKDAMMIDLNVRALVHLSKIFAPLMRARKSGKILNIASTAAFQPGPGMAVYFASKAFVLHFSEALHHELKNYGISVTALCPGPTESQFLETAGMEDARLFKNQKVPTATQVAQYAYKAMIKGKTVAVPGFKNKLLTVALRFAPRDIVTAMAAKFQEKI